MPIQQAVLHQEKLSEQVEPDAFEPPHHKLKPNIVPSLKLLKEYESQLQEMKLPLVQHH